PPQLPYPPATPPPRQSPRFPAKPKRPARPPAIPTGGRKVQKCLDPAERIRENRRTVGSAANPRGHFWPAELKPDGALLMRRMPALGLLLALIMVATGCLDITP